MRVVYSMEAFQMNFFNNKADLRKMDLLNMKIVIRLPFRNDTHRENLVIQYNSINSAQEWLLGYF